MTDYPLRPMDGTPVAAPKKVCTERGRPRTNPFVSCRLTAWDALRSLPGAMVSGMSNRAKGGGRWHEVLAPDGTPRPLYAPVLRDLAALTPGALRTLEEQMDATLREMGVTFHTARSDPWGRQPWTCDLLPQIIDSDDWDLVCRAVRQRLRAW